MVHQFFLFLAKIFFFVESLFTSILSGNVSQHDIVETVSKIIVCVVGYKIGSRFMCEPRNTVSWLIALIAPLCFIYCLQSSDRNVTLFFFAMVIAIIVQLVGIIWRKWQYRKYTAPYVVVEDRFRFFRRMFGVFRHPSKDSNQSATIAKPFNVSEEEAKRLREKHQAEEQQKKNREQELKQAFDRIDSL